MFHPSLPNGLINFTTIEILIHPCGKETATIIFILLQQYIPHSLTELYTHSHVQTQEVPQQTYMQTDAHTHIPE